MNKFHRICKILLESLSDLDLANKQDPSQEHSAVLHKLADHPDINVRKAVADNPATSTKTLNKLLSFENDELPDEDDVPEDEEGWFTKSHRDPETVDLRNKALMNPNVDFKALQAYGAHAGPYSNAILNSVGLPMAQLENPTILDDLFAYGDNDMTNVNNDLISHATHLNDPIWNNILLNHPSKYVQTEMASSSGTHPNMIEKLFNLNDPEIDHALAYNSNLHQDQYEKLSNRASNDQTLHNLASSTALHPDTLTKIFKAHPYDKGINYKLLGNPNAAHLTHQILHNSEPYILRQAIFGHYPENNIKDEHLLTLAKSPNSLVRSTIANNYDIPGHIRDLAKGLK